MAGLEDDLKALDQELPTNPITPMEEQQSAPQASQGGPTGTTMAVPGEDNPGALMAGVAGFNAGVESITSGVLQMIPGLRKPVDDYMVKKTKELSNIEQEHPTAVAMGKFLGIMGISAPAALIPGGLAAQGIKAGALLGAMSYTNADEASYTNMIANKVTGALTGTAVGGITGGAFKAAGATVVPAVQSINNYVKGVVKGSKFLFKDANDIIQDAITKEAGSTEITNATYSTVENKFKDFVKGAEKEGESLYNIRNMIANKSNVNAIERSKVTELAKTVESDVEAGSTTAMKAVKSELKAILGNGKPISYQKAQDLVSEINTKAYSAYVAGDRVLSKSLFKAKDALISDIDTAVQKAGVPELTSAHEVAKAYFMNTTAPLRSISASNHLVDNFTNEKFVQTALLRSSSKNSQIALEATKGLQQLPEDLKKQFVISHLKAIGEASQTAGVFNIKTYANRLAGDIRDIPSLHNLGIDILNISHIADATAMAKNASPGAASGFFTGVGAVASMAFTPAASIPLGILAWKTKFLYAASKLLENPQTSAMLTTLRNSGTVDKNVTQHLMKKLTAAYIAYQSATNVPKIKDTGPDSMDLEAQLEQTYGKGNNTSMSGLRG